MRITVLAAMSLACGTQRPPPAPPPMKVPVSTVAPAELVDSTEYLAQLAAAGPWREILDDLLAAPLDPA